MIRIAIVEDDKEYATKLKNRLLKTDFPEEISIDIYLKPQDFLDALRQEKRCQLCFFDVVMPSMDGMTLAEHAHEMDGRLLIVFLSSWPDYAMDGYNVNAFGYLTKDRLEDGWDVLIGRINRRLEEAREKVYRICTPNSMETVPVDDIVYAYKEGNYCHFVLDGRKETVQTRKSMWDLQRELAAHKQFILVKRGCIVNLRKIRKWKGKEIVMANGERIGIGRMHMDGVREKVMAYMGESW